MPFVVCLSRDHYKKGVITNCSDTKIHPTAVRLKDPCKNSLPYKHHWKVLSNKQVFCIQRQNADTTCASLG